MVYVTTWTSVVATVVVVLKITFLVCHVIKQDHVIKGSDDYNDKKPLR